MSKEEQECELNKAHELYKAALPAFFMNEIEADKTILALSVAAIGFYMALFLNKDFQITELMFITIMISLVSFLIVSAMIMMIFVRNRMQLLHIVETTGGLKEDSFLEALDKAKYWPFIIGILFSIIFTISLMFTKINTKDHQVDQEDNQTISQVVPEKLMQKAFTGIINANINEGFSALTMANHNTGHHHATQPMNVTVNNIQQVSTAQDTNCTLPSNSNTQADENGK